MGMGLVAALGQLRAWLAQSRLPGQAITMGSALLSVALPVVPLTYHYDTHSREGNYIPYDYGYNILSSCDPNAILFTNGDNDTFTLWFLQEVEGIRKDVRVVNLSLLNTDWYIKQLKHMEPRVPIAFSDTQIEQLNVRPWEEQPVSIGGLSWTVPPAIKLSNGRGYLRVQDLMVLHILETNNWQRPLYFAVTVSPDNKVGMEEYHQMEGMVFRVVKTRGNNQMDLDRTHKNLWTVYKYRGIADSTVYKDAQTSNLLRNYSAAFQQLAIMRWQRGEVETAIREMEKYLSLNITNNQVDKTIMAQLYADGKQYDKAAGFAEDLAANHGTFDGYILLSEAYRRDRMEDKTLDILERGLAAHPDYPKGYEQLAKLYFQKGDTARVIETLERWLRVAPGDSTVRTTIAEMKQSFRP
jgi:Flp pilus assembly protein TadD